MNANVKLTWKLKWKVKKIFKNLKKISYQLHQHLHPFHHRRLQFGYSSTVQLSHRSKHHSQFDQLPNRRAQKWLKISTFYNRKPRGNEVKFMVDIWFYVISFSTLTFIWIYNKLQQFRETLFFMILKLFCNYRVICLLEDNQFVYWWEKLTCVNLGISDSSLFPQCHSLNQQNFITWKLLRTWVNLIIFL